MEDTFTHIHASALSGAASTAQASAPLDDPQLMKLINQNAAVLLVLFDLVKRRITYANGYALLLLGYLPETLCDFTPEALAALVHPDDFQRLTRSLDQFAFSDEGQRTTVEFRLLHRSGRYVWVRGTSTRVPASEVVASPSMVCVLEDVTEIRQGHEALRLSEERWYTLFSKAAVGLSEISLDGRFLWVNDELCRLLGRSRMALLAMRVGDVTHAEYVASSYAAVKRVVATGEQESIDKRYLTATGTSVWANTSLTRLDNPDGTPRSLLAVTVDLTERVRAQIARSKSEAEFRALFELAAIGLAQLDAASGRMLLVNRRFAEMVDYPENELMRMRFPELSHPQDLLPIRELLERVAAGNSRELALQRRLLQRGGAAVWVSLTASLIPDDRGQPIRMIVVIQDVTDRRKAELAVQISEERFRAVADLVPDLLWQSDAAGNTVWFNRRWWEYTGLSLPQSLGKTWLEAVHPDDRAQTELVFTEALQTGSTIRREHRLRSQAGGYRWFLVQARPLITEEGQILQWFGAATDIHEQRVAMEGLESRVVRRTRDLDQANQSLRAEIEVRNKAESERQEVLRKLATAQEDERRRVSRELHDQVGQSVTALILGLKAVESQSKEPAVSEQLLRLMKITADIGVEIHELALRLRPTALDDMGLIRALGNYLEEWTSRSNVATDFHFSGFEEKRLPPVIETTLYRIVQEALNNVVKHARAQRVSVILEKSRNQAVAIIEDDGVGFEVPESNLGDQPFRLGLLGMKERVTLVNGELRIESTPGSGTTVYVRIPLSSDVHQPQP